MVSLLIGDCLTKTLPGSAIFIVTFSAAANDDDDDDDNYSYTKEAYHDKRPFHTLNLWYIDNLDVM